MLQNFVDPLRVSGISIKELNLSKFRRPFLRLGTLIKPVPSRTEPSSENLAPACPDSEISREFQSNANLAG